MIEQLFEVATEFKFDVGQALINTNALQQAVDGVSKSSTNALSSLSYLATGLVAHLGFGSGGLLTVLSKAVQLAEEFDTTALNFSNVISSNISVLTGTINNFNDRLATSQMILDDISDTAIKFALPTGDLARITQLISTPLAQRGKLGHNFQGGIEMAKNLMLSSESVQLNPQVMAESLQHVLAGAPLHGALFSRLITTMPFQQAHIRTQSQLAGMNPDKKLELLDKAFKSLASDSEALNYRLNSLHGQMTILKDMFAQMGSVLRPIGEAIRRPLVQVIKYVTDYMKTHAKDLGEQIGKLLGNVLQDPKALFVNLMQLKSFGSDFKKSLHLVELYGTFKFIKYILVELLGITMNGGLLRTMFGALFEGVMAIAALVPWGKILSGVFMVLRAAIVEILPLFTGFLFIMQIISRARALAKVNEIATWLDLAPKFSGLLVRLKTAFENIMLPINIAIDFWAKLLAPLFDSSTYLKILLPLFEGFVFMMELLGKATIYALAAFNGFVYAIVSFVDDMLHLQSPFKNFASNLKKGFSDFLDENKARLGGDAIKATANYVNNIGKIEARFDMREQLEPDRIAFAVTDHLKRLASNPTQGRGQTLGKPFSGSVAFAGTK